MPSNDAGNSTSNNNNSVSNGNGTSFHDFFEGWLVTQRNYLVQLNSLISSQNDHPDEDELKSLVARVLAHYQNYYETKSRVASENVFLLFSPPWFSTLERTFLWIAGFKPAMAFRIVDKRVGDDELTAEQHERIQMLEAETTSMEKALSNEMARLQESIVGPSWVDIVRRMDGQVVDGEVNELVGTIRGGLTDLVTNADFLRTTTAKELVDILTPLQAAKFLAGTAQLQLKIRSWGLQKDADRRG